MSHVLYLISKFYICTSISAQMVKLVDTLVSGTSDRKVVQVRVLFWAPEIFQNQLIFQLVFF